jgi:[ribosomal protein S5]-alanine N-acetyltransferase
VDYFLRSRRLGFRHWADEDFPLAQALWGDPEVTRLFGGPFPQEMVRTRLAHEIRTSEERGIQYWPIFLLEDHQHVGCAGLRPHPAQEAALELGFHLRPSFWGQGLATEAALVVLEYAFSTLGIETIFAGHHPSNDASRRVLGKIGFVYVVDEFYAPSGVMEPIYVFRQEDWRSRQK